MNRRGDLFMLFLNIMFLVAIIFLFWKLSVEFAQPNQGEGIGTRQTALMHTYALSEQMLTYIDTTATYAAYESFDTFAEKAITNPIASACGGYAGYESWTTPGDDCFLTKEEINQNYEKEFLRVLRSFWNFPGMPANILYRIEYDGGTITGVTDDRIRLPIVTAKGAEQQAATNAILNKNFARRSKGSFVQDSSLVSAVVPSPNYRDRSGDVKVVIIVATETDHPSDAINRLYMDGGSSVHYVIDKDGAVTQLVPESKRALFFPECAKKTCTPENPEDIAVAIALVNELSEPKETDCPENTYDSQGECWTEYSELQIGGLKELIAEVLANREIAPENVLFRNEILADDNPGPAFLEAIESKTSFLKEIGSLKSKKEFGLDDTEETEQEEQTDTEEGQKVPQEEQLQGLAAVWPTETKTVSSCVGPRPYLNPPDPNHDGIDMAGEGMKVYAFADGIVEEVCKNGNRCRGNWGNNIIIKHHNGLFSRYNHLKSVAKLVEKNKEIGRGTIIGTTGNTGRSSNPHLDFKIYTSPDYKTQYGGKPENEPGVNPLCYFSEGLLGELKFTGGNCDYDAPLTRSDPVLAKECVGIVPMMQDTDGCFANMMNIGAGGNADVALTMKNIQGQGALLTTIKDEAKDVGVNPNLVLAVIAQESKGEADAVSSTGCTGLGQFCYGTAKVEPYKSIFGGGLRICDCPGNGNCKLSQATCVKNCNGQSSCVGDPRADAIKSAKAIPRLLKQKTSCFDGSRNTWCTDGKPKSAGFKGYKDSVRFGVAAYNGGEGHVESAIKKTGKQDPMWEEVARHVRGETRGYVEKVMKNYASLGGSTLTAFSDQLCQDQQLTVKELGTYWFEPAFTTEVPDLLAPLEGLVAWAEKTYAECTGSGDNRHCLFERKQNPPPGIEFPNCHSVEFDNVLNLRFNQFTKDCDDNRQTNCVCEWTPEPRKDMDVQLYGLTSNVVVDGVSAGEVPFSSVASQYKQTPGDMVSTATLSLRVKEEDQFLVSWESARVSEGLSNAFLKEDDSVPVDGFYLLKDADGMSWTEDPQDVPVCGVYKTQHHLCARLTRSTYKLTTGKIVKPVVKFSMHLVDDNPPTAVSHASTCVTNFGSHLKLTFPPSASEDVSYYRISCRRTGIQPSDNDAYIQKLGREREPPLDQPIGTEMEEILRICTGGTVNPVFPYSVRVTPYDISGNEGSPTEVQVEAYFSDQDQSQGIMLETLKQSCGQIQTQGMH